MDVNNVARNRVRNNLLTLGNGTCILVDHEHGTSFMVYVLP